MKDQLDLLDYPNWPGFRARDTSKAAADAMAPKAGSLRDRTYWIIEASVIGQTADEVASLMDESILAIRPRVTELARMGLIRDSGHRRKNISGKAAIVWVSDVGKMTAYYNENDPYAAQWLRNLIAAGHIADGGCR